MIISIKADHFQLINKYLEKLLYHNTIQYEDYIIYEYNYIYIYHISTIASKYSITGLWYHLYGINPSNQAICPPTLVINEIIFGLFNIDVKGYTLLLIKY